MEITELKLEPCPFCASTKLKLDKKSKHAGYNGLDWPVKYNTYSVRCNVCHARGGSVGGKVIPHFNFFKGDMNLHLPEWATTDEELREKAISAWNRRAADEN